MFRLQKIETPSLIQVFKHSALPLIALVAFLQLMLSSCAGYKLGAHEKLPRLKDVDKIFVPTFVNNTAEPRIATIYTNALIAKLQKDNIFKVSGKSEAQAYIICKIDEVDRRQASSFRGNILNTKRMEIEVRVNTQIVMADNGKVVSSFDVRESDNAFLDENQQTTERYILSILSEKIAKSITEKISIGWW